VLQDRKVEAWALHQLGSRALALDMTNQAESLLREAKHIRQEIGDNVGLSLTKQNLDLFSNSSVPLKVKKQPEAASHNSWKQIIRRIFYVTVLSASIAGGFFVGRDTFEPQVITKEVLQTVPVTREVTHEVTAVQTLPVTREVTREVTVVKTVAVQQTVVSYQTVIVTLPPKDNTAPSQPSIIDPKYVDENNPLSCNNNIFLKWNSVNDPTKPITYHVRAFLFYHWNSPSLGIVEYLGSIWDFGYISGTNLDITPETKFICDNNLKVGEFAKIFWTVAAQDGAGNQGDYEIGEFLIRKPYLIP
jgi:hypothetical protein